MGGDLVFLAGLSCWRSHHPSYFPFSWCTENCPWLQLWLSGKDMPSLIFDKVSFSLVHYESCAMGIGNPPLSLNSWLHCRWNSLCVMILGLQSMSLALSLKDILGCYGQSWPSGLHSDIFKFWGADLETTLPTQTALFIGIPFQYSPQFLPKCSQDVRK